MTTRLNQWLAVSQGVQARTRDRMTAAYHVLQKPVPLSGITRTYKPKDELGDTFPAESTLVQLTAEGLLAEVVEALTELFDVTATREYGNCEAKADVKIGDLVLLRQVPVAYLLFLEKQLVDWRTFVTKMPTLDPSETWHLDPATGVGVYVTEPTETNRTQKTPFRFEKAPATDKHQADVEVMYTDVIVGVWSRRLFSGAMPAARVKQLTDRVDQLAAAVKFAREEANTYEIDKRKDAAALFTWLTAV